MGFNDVDITTGVDASPVAAGLAEMRNQVNRTMTQISSELAKPLAGAAILSFLEGVISKAHELHHEAERFGIDAEQLQTISNAAKEDGISIEAVARSMNRLEIATGAALAGNQQMAAAFGALDISLLDFQNLNPQQKMLALADAVKKAGQSTETYDAVAKILGSRFGTELIPLLLRGGDAMQKISEAAGIMSNETVARLEWVHKNFVKFWNEFQVIAGTALSWLMGVWKSEWELDKAVFMIFKDAIVGGWHEVERAMHLDFKGAAAEWHKGLEQMKNDAIAAKDAMVKVFGAVAGKSEFAFKPEEGFQPPGGSLDDMPDASTHESTRAGKGGGGGGATSDEREESAIDRLSQKTRQYYLETLSLGAKVNEVQKERNALEDQLNQRRLDGNITDKEDAELQENIADKDHEIDKVRDELNKKSQAALDTAQQEEIEQGRSLQLLQQHVKGHDDVAEKLKVQWEYQDKINDITNQLNQAYDQLNEAYKTGDKTLIDQAAQTTKILENTLKTAQAEEKLAQAAEQKAQAEKNKELERERVAAVMSGTAPEWMGQSGGTGIPAGTGSGTPMNIAEALATDPRTGVINKREYERLNALANLRVLHGEQPWGFEDAQRAKAIETQLGQNQYNSAKAREKSQTATEEQYYSMLASGRWTDEQLAQMPQFATLFPTAASAANLFGSSSAPAGAQAAKTDKVISELQAIRAELSRPGAPAAILSGTPAAQSQLADLLRQILGIVGT